jgi:pyruvate-formate lyase
VELFPGFEVAWIERKLGGKPSHFHERPGDRFIVGEETKRELKELLPLRRGKTHCERVLSLLPDEAKKAWEMMVINSYWLMEGGDGHITIDFKTILGKGLKGIIGEVEDRLSRLDLITCEAVAKRNFYYAVLIALGAAVEYASRYAEYAKNLAREEKNPRRREELERMVEICGRVPLHPTKSFHEALQSVLFIQMILQIENNGHYMSLGRFDQTPDPYLQRDIDEGTLSLEEAAELAQNLWLKLFSVNKIRDWDSTRFFAGYQVYQNITLGGQLSGGRDAANLLPYLFLVVQKAVRLTTPSLSVRYHDGISEHFLQAVIDIIRLRGGQPALYSDETVIPALMNRGIAYEDAVNWSVVGCVEPIVEGKEGYRKSPWTPSSTPARRS